MAQRKKTQAERELEREEAIQKQELQLSGANRKGSRVTSDQIPSEILRPKPNKIFIAMGVVIVAFLVFSIIYSIWAEMKRPAKKKAVPAATPPMPPTAPK